MHIELFRIGDYYEAFDEDAETASDVLKLSILRRRDGRLACGILYYFLDDSIARLVKAGHQIKINEAQ